MNKQQRSLVYGNARPDGRVAPFEKDWRVLRAINDGFSSHASLCELFSTSLTSGTMAKRIGRLSPRYIRVQGECYGLNTRVFSLAGYRKGL